MKMRIAIPILILMTASLLVGGIALAAPDQFSLFWWTVDGGGWTYSEGGNYTLGGTAGQSDAGWMSGGNFTLGGGFWGGGAVQKASSMIYIPVLMR